ncbi:hypothetical protein AAHE18_20G225900 [Arachis hypogaea]
MATRVIPARILRKIRYNRATTTTAAATKPLGATPVFERTEHKPPSSAASAATIAAPSSVDTDYIPRRTLDLEDTEKLFSSVSTWRLLRSSAVLHATAVGPMVDVGMRVMRSRKIRSLNEAGLRGMLVYGVEDAHDNDGCNRNLNGFLHTVDVSRSLPMSSVSFVIVKITAICPMTLLERISDLLRWQQKDPSFNLPWKRDSLPIFAESSPLYHTQKKPEALTLEEERDLELATHRLVELCQKCVQANIPLLVDAEHTTVQPAIDYFTYSSAIVHNKDDNPIVFGTIQTYLKDSKERLLLALKAADKMGIPMGFKLVRGAYMSMESRIAESFGFESPIHDTIEDTHKCFNDCSSFLLEKVADGPGSLVLATHNVESGKLAAAKAHELGMGKVHHKLEFAQLCGMSESLSFGLSNAGFQVSKYLPFGPVDKVMPYLLRRAEENRGLLAASGFDRQLMRKEIGRRLKAAVF